MPPSQHAFLNAQVALSAWHAARDAEAQVADWLIEARTTREELIEYRQRSKRAHEAHRRAQRVYARACEQVITQRAKRQTTRGPAQACHLDG